MPYFLYRSQNIANLGGVLPNPQPPEDYQLGITEKDGFYLGYVDDPQKIEQIKDYFVCFIDDDTAEGFRLVGVTQLPEDPTDPESSMRDLTEEELAKQEKAERLLAKLRFRNSVESNIGDIPDIIADLSKRLEIIERLVFKVCYYLLQDQSIDQSVKDQFLSIVTSYVDAVDNGTLKTRVDLEDLNELYNRVYERVNTLTNLLETEYLSVT